MQIVELNIEVLKPYEKNPRKNDDAVEYVANSIKEFGFKVPIVIDKDNVIVAGHTRYKAAKRLNIKKVPCIIADDLTPEQIKAYRLADNKVAEKAEWDFDLLNGEEITKRVLEDVGYRTNYKIIDNLGKQSNDIAQGVDTGGAGDQGMMFGYACNDTPQLLPTAMVILQEFAKTYDNLRKREPELYYPDGKAQITGYYDDNFKLVKIKDFTISYQNCEKHRGLTDEVVKAYANCICNKYKIPVERYLINPTGKFLIGGFDGDAGLTGRKIVVDSYQSFANVGGGCMNGKDPTKVDFSAAHKARELACRYLKKYDLNWCEVQLSYAIGIAEPLAIYVRSNKGEFEVEKDIYTECTPNNIIYDLKLKELDFEELAKYGHFTS